MWIPREIETLVRSTAAQRPAVIVTGCRQSGKTSLLRAVFPDCAYASLDLPREAREAEESGEAFLRRHGTPLILDEVQYAPGLLRYVKAAIDANRSVPGQFLITGSQKFPLMSGVTESLAGRASILHLHSLSLAELESWSGQMAEGNRLLEWMVAGGYPEIHSRGLSPGRYYSDYTATYLERDVRQLINVRNLGDFDRFMQLLALRTGQLLSVSSLATDIGVSPNTLKSWLTVLEASNIIHLLTPYSRNVGKRLIKTPKVYFLDTGLACHLAGIASARDLASNAMLGPLFETLVLGQWLRHRHNRGLDARIHFYRDHSGIEVDFVIAEGTKCHLLECKWSENPSRSVRGFVELEKLLGAANIASRNLVNPVRSSQPAGTDVRLLSCVDVGTVGTEK